MNCSVHACHTEYLCTMHNIYPVNFVICMTAAREGYEENDFYKDFQDQLFEGEVQQLLNDQDKCP
jgi:hypothetical protein